MCNSSIYFCTRIADNNNTTCGTIAMQLCEDGISLDAEETNLERNTILRSNLRKWAVQHQISHMALKSSGTDIEKNVARRPKNTFGDSTRSNPHVYW